MKIACKTNDINTLTKDKIYDVIKGSWEDGRFFIKDDFENEQWYFYEQKQFLQHSFFIFLNLLTLNLLKEILISTL